MENRNNLLSEENTTLYTDSVLHPGRVLLRNYRESWRRFLMISESVHWRDRSVVHAQHQCTVRVSIQTLWGMQVLQHEVDGHRHRTFKVHLIAPKEFFSSSPALLHWVHCLTCPILPERERKSNRSAILDLGVWQKTKRLFNGELVNVAEMKPHTSSLGAFLLGDFCLDSLRIFPLDFSFSLSLSLSRPFLSFSPSDSGEAWRENRLESTNT